MSHRQPAERAPSPAARDHLSYYATLALAEATILDDWLARTEALIREDVAASRLLPDFQDKLCVLGDTAGPRRASGCRQ